jgi:hypothetical protein
MFSHLHPLANRQTLSALHSLSDWHISSATPASINNVAGGGRKTRPRRKSIWDSRFQFDTKE